VRFLLDEMFQPAACRPVADAGHEAVHVRDIGLDGRPDAEVAAAAVHDDRVLVTENVKDFAGEADLVVLCLRKPRPFGGALPQWVAESVDTWARANPAPYVGLHWP
jgi:predicted nuclease of predicted toxin-antitoxin system